MPALLHNNRAVSAMLKKLKALIGILVLIFGSFALQPTAMGEYFYSKHIYDFEINSHGFLSQEGIYYIYGEIKNVGSTNYTNLSLKYTFYDNEGKEIFSVTRNIELRVLLSGRISPFANVLVNKEIASKVKSYKIEILSYDEIKKDELPPFGLKIVNYRLQNDTIIGVIENHGTAKAAFVRVYALFYYQNKSIMVLSSLSTNIEKGESWPFVIEFPELNASSINIENAAYYSLTAESINFLLDEEVEYRPFSIQAQGNQEEGIPWWNDPVILTFIICVAFSAIVLIVVYFITRFIQWRKKRYLRKVKRRHYEFEGGDECVT